MTNFHNFFNREFEIFQVLKKDLKNTLYQLIPKFQLQNTHIALHI